MVFCRVGLFVRARTDEIRFNVEMVTKRELEVMEMAAIGRTDKEISSLLGVSPDTVSTYWRRILARSQSSSRTQAIATYLRNESAEMLSKAQTYGLEMRNLAKEKSREAEKLSAVVAIAESQLEQAGVSLVVAANDGTLLYVSEIIFEWARVELDARPAVRTVGDLLRKVGKENDIEKGIETFIAGLSENSSTPIEFTCPSGKDVTVARIATERDEDVLGIVFTHGMTCAYHVGSETIIELAAGLMLAETMDSKDKAIDEAFKKLGQVTNVDRIYTFCFDPATNCWNNTHEWTARGISQEKENLQNVPASVFAWWKNCLDSDGMIEISELSQLGPDALEEKKALEDQGIKSLLVYRIIGPSVSGFVGFDCVRTVRKWRDSERELLNNLATLLGSLNSACLINK